MQFLFRFTAGNFPIAVRVGEKEVESIVAGVSISLHIKVTIRLHIQDRAPESAMQHTVLFLRLIVDERALGLVAVQPVNGPSTILVKTLNELVETRILQIRP